MIDSQSEQSRNISQQYPENQNQQVLSVLLDELLSKNNQILVQQTQMGGVEAYIGAVTLEWFANRVKFASALPLLQKKYNPETENIEIDADSIDEVQQRPLDWSRQAPLVQYLAARKNHKFPPVLVVINQPWVDDPKADEWDSEGRAKKATTGFTPLDQNGTVGLLNVAEENVSIYALDGQHRLMGVQGLLELIKTGKLRRYKKDKIANDSFITLSDLIEHYQVNADYLENKIPQEKIGIEFICAVNAGETYTEAKRRVRSIFVHVNLMAAPLTKGQLTQLNEDDGFAIAARKIAVTHPLLADKDNRKPRINWNSATVATNSTVLTTLQALQDMSERYLGQKFPHWKPLEKGLIPMRPEDEELQEGINDFTELFDYLASLPSYKILEHEDTPVLRRFSFEKDGSEGNMLFRPVSQVALAQALGILVFKKGFSLEAIFKKLRKFDRQGGFSGMEYPQSLWYGVLYDPNKKRVQVAGKDLAVKLLIYIVGGMKDQMEVVQLRKALADARTIEDKTIGFDGKLVEPQDVGLPTVL
ncbi:DGQHR domain-containing protein [Sphaerospermopsis aphanizomenoides BCCUSP55]|uniref:DGQHR domain-containing protein n=1 Tax=Sphaerospermopsis aphanizomenoides TaxID=459663 RepID=UPI00190606B1|nr:DGQHR domain-containing protein [Sphaerospermopsis aphanizomenoides]MBK1988908.1 DGQHR domain-containing protein [Sphaerospermopsis aphanizomenoides BCCUSP55]